MTQAIAIREEMPLTELGTVLAKSGFFQDATDPGKAIVKILAGRELGIPAIAAMTGIYIVKGRVSLSANIMATLVKRSGKYNYRLVQHTAEVCEIAFYENNVDVGHSLFTAADARKAGTQNMDKYAKNMLFARAMSNGVKWYCPDVTGGPAYTPEEMGAQVDGEGEVIDVPAHAPAKATNGNGHKDEPHEIPPASDEELRYLAMASEPESVEQPETVKAPTPAPKPDLDKPVQKFASINVVGPRWLGMMKELAKKHEHYQTKKDGKATGQPNSAHILAAALKEGFAEINDDNMDVVVERLDRRVAELA